MYNLRCTALLASFLILASAPVAGAQIVEVRVAAPSDDAEQTQSGNISITSTDLEMTFDRGGSQTVGMRFQNVAVPRGAAIVDAYIQFQADESTSVATSLTIAGQADGNPSTFTTASGSITARPRTVAQVAWSPPPWSSGDATLAQRTPNLSPVIQEIVELAGWANGNSLVLLVTGTGERVAESYNGVPAAAPLLHIEYSSSGNLAPVVAAGADQTVDIDDTTVNLDGDVDDDGQTGILQTLWTHTGGTGTGTVTFADATAIDTSATLPQASGTYVLRLTADDGEFAVFDEATMTVLELSGGTLIDEDFSAGSQGFAYEDDAFRNTSAPAYASGNYSANGGNGGGALQVTLGGIDGADIFGMSGGWGRSFTLAESSDVTVTFQYNLTQAANYESDEFSDALVSVDGALHGSGANDYVARINGNGNGGSAQSTGFQSFSFTVNALAAGTHSLRFGGYNNKKTFTDESTQIAIDNVLVSAVPAGPGGGGDRIVGFTQINMFETGFVGGNPLTIPSTDPSSVVYHPPSGRLFIADSEINEIPQVFALIQANVFEVSPTGDTLFASYDLTDSPSGFFNHKEPTGLTYLASDAHFYSTNDDNRTLFRYRFDAAGFTLVDSISTQSRTSDPEGATSDALTGTIYVIGGDFRIVAYRYAGGFQHVATYDLLQTANDPNGIPLDPEGIVFDPVSRHLFVVSDPDDALFEYTLGGVYVSTLDLSVLDPRPIAIQGATIGPSTAAAGEMSLFVSDGGVDNDQNPNERDGRVYELQIIRGQ